MAQWSPKLFETFPNVSGRFAQYSFVKAASTYQVCSTSDIESHKTKQQCHAPAFISVISWVPFEILNWDRVWECWNDSLKTFAFTGSTAQAIACSCKMSRTTTWFEHRSRSSVQYCSYNQSGADHRAWCKHKLTSNGNVPACSMTWQGATQRRRLELSDPRPFREKRRFTHLPLVTSFRHALFTE